MPAHRNRLNAGTLTPLTQLRVLRVGSQRRQPFASGELPASLLRLVIVAETGQVIEQLVPQAVRPAGMAVEYDCVSGHTFASSVDVMFAEGGVHQLSKHLVVHCK